eukprot:1180781-Prymnesium_polylepis.1
MEGSPAAAVGRSLRGAPGRNPAIPPPLAALRTSLPPSAPRASACASVEGANGRPCDPAPRSAWRCDRGKRRRAAHRAAHARRAGVQRGPHRAGRLRGGRGACAGGSCDAGRPGGGLAREARPLAARLTRLHRRDMSRRGLRAAATLRAAAARTRVRRRGMGGVARAGAAPQP